MIYTNETIRIVPFERDKHMTERYRSWFHDPEATRYNSHGLFPYTKEQMQAFVATLEGDRSRIVWAIEIKSTEKPFGESTDAMIASGGWNLWYHVGNVSLQSINLLNRSAELAIVIGDSEARGKGIGTQVCQWVLDHAFLRLGLNRVWTGTAFPNTAMNRICRYIGMAEEGRFRDGAFLNGEFVDIVAYGITCNKYFKHGDKEHENQVGKT